MNLFISVLLIISNVSSPVSNLEIFHADIKEIVDSINKSSLISGEFATSTIEFERVICDDAGDNFYYYDFCGDNGFIVLNEREDIVLFSECYDFPEIKTNKAVTYEDFLSIYHYKTENYEGLPEYGAGSIGNQFDDVIEYDEISNYIQSKYSLADFDIFSSGKLSGLTSSSSNIGYTQSEESIFVKNGYSEGNCGIVSTSNAIAYYSEFGEKSNFPVRSSHETFYCCDESDVCVQFSDNGYQPRGEAVSIHTICMKEWRFAIDNGYNGGGLNDTTTKIIFESTAEYYGYNATFTPCTTFTLSQTKNEIDNGRPLQLRTGGDVVYGGHGMMITGYSEYRAQTYIGRFLALLELPFVSIFDGRSQNERWFDLTCLSNVGSAYSRSSSQSVALLEVD